MFSTLLYILILANTIFLIAIFFFFRTYIQRELKKNEYIRRLERELEDLVLSMNQSAEQITQIIESKVQQLQELLHKHDEVKRSWGLLEQNTEQQSKALLQLKKDAEQILQNFRLQVDAQTVDNPKKEKQLLLDEGIRTEIQTALKAEVQAEIRAQLKENFEADFKEDLAKSREDERQILEPKLRKEIEHYIELGLDARIIQQKTGVNLGLLEVLIGMKEM